MKKISTTLVCILLIMTAAAQNTFIPKGIIQKTSSEIQKNSRISSLMIMRGVTQTAELWTEADGTPEEFSAFCIENFCSDSNEKQSLFNRLCDNFEAIMGHNNAVIISLCMPVHCVGYETLPIDEMFAAYDGSSHFTEDMFANKIAFVVTLNFPHFTLKEKSENAEKWSDLEWGYARLGDWFTSRVPADKLQAITAANTAADTYISNYNICMGSVKAADGTQYWNNDLKLITHWGLRDELKAAYADSQNGLEKQKIIYAIMKNIIGQTIPKDVINRDEYFWQPTVDKTYKGTELVSLPRENDVRYQYLLDNFHAVKAADPFYPGNTTFLDRRFNDDLEFSQQDIENLFTAFLSSPEVQTVADLISKKLGRKLQPWDIWYSGFKNRSAVAESDLDRLTRAKYPTKEAFAADLPNILTTLGFTREKADFICSHVTVDASVGAGHAWESMMKSDNARLRTRIGANGMDYKGFNIGVHEFGHNVEQTFSLHNVPNYFLAGVPNTAFTEALAFTFQQRDLQLLGTNSQDTIGEYYDLLDNFWSCYEIMGVSLLDIQVWKWMYANPNATAAELKEAVNTMALEIWNQYYAPVFKVKDQPILAVYSHMIDAPLYLSAYPLGYLISFQLQSYFKNKNLGEEVERVFSQGRLIPQYWLQKAVGSKLTATPFVKAAANAAQVVGNYEKQQSSAQKSTKKVKK
ncbi:MAG: hypothetical protein MJZ49_02505 [Bacteroidales bacterium]|nr:hypothetical protein [Bacteroidales bacterium]